ncbi:heparinase II/III family protein [Loktanella sp. TSTF-M6]|uniref:Heparinase II/III family protein n=1 Tax=Loktanella gaetbuli TaxID=2881335 RepID=A0ABS8BUP9_9RHOB|nr:heparinase II/III family protein [Loktanella gaetbuli]MCB5199387.1 heparinase II/III family protein [Loktanella gaetbuli]
MAQNPSWQARLTTYLHQYHARRAARAKPVTGFVSQPEPRSIGLFARGKQLLAGNFLFAGVLTTSPDGSIWDAQGDRDLVDQELHGFAWLDDLAAVGDGRARAVAQAWVAEWIDDFGDGTGPGWTPDLTGRRLIRWISHGLMLLRGLDRDAQDRFFQSLGQQTLFLSRRWRAARAGLPRFEALAGMIYAGLSLEGMEDLTDPAIAALASDCADHVGSDGGIASRNPEELMDILTLLLWAQDALEASARPVPAALTDALGRIAPTLRSLRHADGGLARFHGGGRGVDGRLDQALARLGATGRGVADMGMGYARIAAGRTSVIVDGAVPPQHVASYNAHAATLAFELTSGRRPLVVNCGSGVTFGADWRRAGRATPSHSTLCMAGYSSSRLGQAQLVGGVLAEPLIDTPTDVQCIITRMDDGHRAELSHDGFRLTHGQTHARILEMTLDGRGLVGEDLLTTLNDLDKERFERACGLTGGSVPFAIRFHLHPDVEAHVDLGGAAVSMALKSGEIWVFRHDGHAELALTPSVYLETGRLKPRAAQQVVLSGVALSYATRIRWSLTKAQDTPDVVRDLAPARTDDDDASFEDDHD